MDFEKAGISGKAATAALGYIQESTKSKGMGRKHGKLFENGETCCWISRGRLRRRRSHFGWLGNIWAATTCKEPTVRSSPGCCTPITCRLTSEKFEPKECPKG